MSLTTFLRWGDEMHICSLHCFGCVGFGPGVNSSVCRTLLISSLSNLLFVDHWWGYKFITPFSVRRIPTFLEGIRYAEPWYAVRQQKCK